MIIGYVWQFSIDDLAWLLAINGVSSLLFFPWSEFSTYFIFMAVLIKAAGRQIGLSTEAGGSSLQSSLTLSFIMTDLRSASNFPALIISEFIPGIVNILCRLREHSVHLSARA